MLQLNAKFTNSHQPLYLNSLVCSSTHLQTIHAIKQRYKLNNDMKLIKVFGTNINITDTSLSPLFLSRVTVELCVCASALLWYPWTEWVVFWVDRIPQCQKSLTQDSEVCNGKLGRWLPHRKVHSFLTACQTYCDD